jgi:hypothetical protein
LDTSKSASQAESLALKSELSHLEALNVNLKTSLEESKSEFNLLEKELDEIKTVYGLSLI